MAIRSLAVCCALAGCWREDARVDGVFTPDEWEFLSTQFVLPEPQRCPAELNPTQCDRAALLGQALFFEKKLSGPIKIDDPAAPGALGEPEKVACADCHATAPVKIGNGLFVPFFVDTRSQPSNVSSGAIFTGHNAMSVVNVAYKSAVAAQQCTDEDPATCSLVYSWIGKYATPGGVLNLAGTNAMNSKPDRMASVICGNPAYRAAYVNAFDAAPARCANLDPPHDDATVFASLALAFEAYTRRLVSVNSRFDRYVAGELVDGQPALDEHERRGLALFIGKAMCVDCHRGPLLSDLKFHATGVAQRGVHVAAIDLGLGDVVGDQAHDGEFLTPPLRHVAETAPYMHAGQLATLADVIEHYRRGGDTEGFSGRKDPRIEPLEIDDDEARDLEAFLRTLTGERIPEALAAPPALPVVPELQR